MLNNNESNERKALEGGHKANSLTQKASGA